MGWIVNIIVGFIIAVMAGKFVSILKNPITSIILVCEITSSINYALPIILVVIVSKYTSNILIKEYKLNTVSKYLLEIIASKRKMINENDTIKDKVSYNIEKVVEENI